MQNIVKKDPGRARQNSLATEGTNFTKPGARNKVDLSTSSSFSHSLSAYPSFLRPKEMPEIDYFTLFAIRILWTFSAIVRSSNAIVYFFIKIRVMHLVNWLFLKLQVLLC